MMLREDLKELHCRRDFSLRERTSFRIGGRARYFYEVDAYGQLAQLYSLLFEEGSDFHLLGAGSNILITDGQLEKVVISLGKGFSELRHLDKSRLEVGAAMRLSALGEYCRQKGLGGLEEFSGIPASLGGMAVMNASSFGKEFSSLIEGVEVASSEGAFTFLKRDEIEFGYRTSSLKGKIVTKVILQTQEKGTEAIKTESVRFLKKRTQEQDFRYPSAGSVFKNSPGAAAGYLIEACDLKGKRKGDAQVSQRHANFIINRANAKSDEVIYLIEFIKDKVYNKFTVLLEEEIERWQM